jgi:hypothetical protein
MRCSPWISSPSSVQVERRGQDLAAHCEYPARLADGRLEIAGNAGHRSDEEVAEGVALEARALAEAVLEQAGHQWFGVGKRGDAAPQVPRRKDAELFPQAA